MNQEFKRAKSHDDHSLALAQMFRDAFIYVVDEHDAMRKRTLSSLASIRKSLDEFPEESHTIDEAKKEINQLITDTNEHEKRIANYVVDFRDMVFRADALRIKQGEKEDAIFRPINAVLKVIVGGINSAANAMEKQAERLNRPKSSDKGNDQ